jgi:hypothetical protein
MKTLFLFEPCQVSIGKILENNKARLGSENGSSVKVSLASWDDGNLG